MASTLFPLISMRSEVNRVFNNALDVPRSAFQKIYDTVYSILFGYAPGSAAHLAALKAKATSSSAALKAYYKAFAQRAQYLLPTATQEHIGALIKDTLPADAAEIIDQKFGKELCPYIKTTLSTIAIAGLTVAAAYTLRKPALPPPPPPEIKPRCSLPHIPYFNICLLDLIRPNPLLADNTIHALKKAAPVAKTALQFTRDLAATATTSIVSTACDYKFSLLLAGGFSYVGYSFYKSFRSTQENIREQFYQPPPAGEGLREAAQHHLDQPQNNAIAAQPGQPQQPGALVPHQAGGGGALARPGQQLSFFNRVDPLAVVGGELRTQARDLAQVIQQMFREGINIVRPGVSPLDRMRATINCAASGGSIVSRVVNFVATLALLPEAAQIQDIPPQFPHKEDDGWHLRAFTRASNSSPQAPRLEDTRVPVGSNIILTPPLSIDSLEHIEKKHQIETLSTQESLCLFNHPTSSNLPLDDRFALAKFCHFADRMKEFTNLQALNKVPEDQDNDLQLASIKANTRPALQALQQSPEGAHTLLQHKALDYLRTLSKNLKVAHVLAPLSKEIDDLFDRIGSFDQKLLDTSHHLFATSKRWKNPKAEGHYFHAVPPQTEQGPRALFGMVSAHHPNLEAAIPLQRREPPPPATPTEREATVVCEALHLSSLLPPIARLLLRDINNLPEGQRAHVSQTTGHIIPDGGNAVVRAPILRDAEALARNIVGHYLPKPTDPKELPTTVTEALQPAGETLQKIQPQLHELSQKQADDLLSMQRTLTESYLSLGRERNLVSSAQKRLEALQQHYGENAKKEYNTLQDQMKRLQQGMEDAYQTLDKLRSRDVVADDEVISAPNSAPLLQEPRRSAAAGGANAGDDPNYHETTGDSQPLLGQQPARSSGGGGGAGASSFQPGQPNPLPQ